jgi:peptide methionine sulfoxide reductase MsrB
LDCKIKIYIFENGMGIYKDMEISKYYISSMKYDSDCGVTVQQLIEITKNIFDICCKELKIIKINEL